MQILSKEDLLAGHKVKSLEFCEHCVFGKLHRNKFPKAINRTKGTLITSILIAGVHAVLSLWEAADFLCPLLMTTQG